MKRSDLIRLGKRILIILLALFPWLLLWQFAAWRIDIPFLLPSPLSVLDSLWNLLQSKVFYKAIGNSLVSLLIGFGGGAAIGILSAVPSALSKTFTSFVSPVYTVIRATPVASFIIIAWVFLDKGVLPAFIALLMTAPIIWSNLSRGIRSLDRSLYEVTRVYRFSFFKTLRVYFIPALAPFLSSGISTALGLAWKSTIATEILVKSNDTIGYYIWDAKAWSIDTAALFAWTVAVILFSLLFDTVIGLLFSRIGEKASKSERGESHA